MTSEEIKSLLSYIRKSGLTWDMIESVDSLIDDPKSFLKEFKKTHSPEVCNLIDGRLDTLLPTYLSCGDRWLEALAAWRLSHQH